MHLHKFYIYIHMLIPNTTYIKIVNALFYIFTHNFFLLNLFTSQPYGKPNIFAKALNRKLFHLSARKKNEEIFFYLYIKRKSRLYVFKLCIRFSFPRERRKSSTVSQIIILLVFRRCFFFLILVNK